MIETFAALLFAHVIADFVLQTGYIAMNKRRAGVLLLHSVIVLLTAQAALGRVDALELVALALIHGVADWAKARFGKPGLGPFLADQAVHAGTVLLVASYDPGLWAGGLWAAIGADWLPALMALVAGAILATRAGGFAVGLLVRPWADVDLPKGLTNGGALIGLLERGLIFLLVMVDQAAGIGFLIAAKSILRFETTSKDQKAGEYVIIGALASFGWALIFAYGTRALMAELPPLGIPAANP